MKIIKRTITPTLAFLLALLMAIFLFPVSAAAAQKDEEETEDIGQAEETGEESADALFELTDLRTADTK